MHECQEGFSEILGEEAVDVEGHREVGHLKDVGESTENLRQSRIQAGMKNA